MSKTFGLAENIHGVLFFKEEKDFYATCVKDPYNRGYTLNMCPIRIPSSFPAAFEYRQDFDPRCTGEYVEVDFQKAAETAKQLLKLDLQHTTEVLAFLNSAN